MCFNKPRRRIRAVSDKAYHKKQETDRAWFEANPPSPKGTWDCYLQISPQCLMKVTRSTINLEHVRSKARHPELAYDPNNIKPACQPCNKLKGSMDLEDLVDNFPHLGAIIRAYGTASTAHEYTGN